MLMDNYRLHWRVASPKIYLAFEVETNGWVGFGIGEPTSGSMPGSDIVTGWVTSTGEVKIQDRNAIAKAFPDEDTCADWELVSGKELNGKTIIEVSRLLDTGDKQDRPILPGKTRVVCAYGNEDRVRYHSSNRKGAVVVFIEDNETKNEENTNDEIDFSAEYKGSYQIEPIETNYVCTGFPLPVDKSRHVIKIDPIVDPITAQYVHHFIIFQCDPTKVKPNWNVSTACMDMEGCINTVWAWAPGMDSFVLPDDVGIRVGNDSDSLSYLMIEIHYDNPNLDQPAHADRSGFRFHYTKEPRKMDMGVLILGDTNIGAGSIPPGMPNWQLETNCPQECTKKFSNEITIFSYFAHMHQVGAQIWSTQWRDGALVQELHRIDYYDFGFQQATSVNLTVKPGDVINHHCVYDTTSKTKPTKFGVASSDEMCLSFLSYYPKLKNNMASCGMLIINAGGQVYNGTACGMEYLPLPNPTRYDPAGGDVKVFGTPCDSQNTDTGNDGPSSGSYQLLGGFALICAMIMLIA